MKNFNKAILLSLFSCFVLTESGMALAKESSLSNSGINFPDEMFEVGDRNYITNQIKNSNEGFDKNRSVEAIEDYLLYGVTDKDNISDKKIECNKNACVLSLTYPENNYGLEMYLLNINEVKKVHFNSFDNFTWSKDGYKTSYMIFR